MSSAEVISVFGGGDVAAGSAEYALAEQVGLTLGRAGYSVATGGYGGAMEAASRGGARAGAEVIGVTCRLWSSRPNRFVTRQVETDDYYQRLRTLVELGAGYVALPGLTGTLVELALVWELAAKEASRRRPIVCVGGCWRGVRDVIVTRAPQTASLVAFVAGADELGRYFPGPG
ncbi:MAG: LOG family protein [Planctomycetota bacterium]|jgi:uncharacterized protein (TIGR00725 family)